MDRPTDFRELSCAECAGAEALSFDFTMAFQPIVDLEARAVLAYEALVRGPGDAPAGAVFAQVHDGNRYRFDQSCRVKAIRLAARLGVPCLLNINFLPNAVYRPELCIRTTLAAAREYDFPIERIVFEVTEGEQVRDKAHLKAILEHYQQRGFQTAIDDFGAGYSGLNLLAEYQPHFVKLDMALVRGIHGDFAREAIVRGIVQVCGELGIRVIAEGVETPQELACLRSLGVSLVQGYLFARPGFETLPTVDPAAFS